MIARWSFLAYRHARNALARYRRVAPAALWRDHARRRALLGGAIVAPRPPLPRAERIVVGLTTIPERARLIAPTLRGLIDQSEPADRIILAWPRVSRRSAQAYPPPPDIAGIDIVRCDDLGPVSKLVPALRAEPDALLIVVDDDVIYPRDFIETLLRAHRADPGAALGYRGWKLEPARDPRDLHHVFATSVGDPEDVDILLGTWGYLLPPGLAPEGLDDFSGWPEEARWVDDVWISGHLNRRGIRRRVVPARSLPLETGASAIGALTDGLNRSGENDRMAIAAFEPWR